MGPASIPPSRPEHPPPNPPECASKCIRSRKLSRNRFPHSSHPYVFIPLCSFLGENREGLVLRAGRRLSHMTPGSFPTAHATHALPETGCGLRSPVGRAGAGGPALAQRDNPSPA